MTINSGDSGKLYLTFTKDASLTLQSNSINTADYNQLNKALSRAASSRQSGHIYYTESGLQFMTQEQAKKVKGAVKVPLAVLDELIKKFTKYSQDEKKLTLKERDEMRRLVVKDNGYLNSLCSSAEGLVQTTRDTLLKEAQGDPVSEKNIQDFFKGIKNYYSVEESGIQSLLSQEPK